MIAKLPAALQDVIDAWPLVLGVIALIGWVGRRQRAWTKAHISDPIHETRSSQDAIGKEVREIRHLVRYHLGPNGEAKPLHHRVSDIERANGIEATSPKDWMKDDWGQV